MPAFRIGIGAVPCGAALRCVYRATAGPLPFMRRLRWLILGVSILALMVVAAPFLVPLKQFTPQLSELISMRLGHPVALSDLRLSLWPTPGATVQGVRIGKASDILVEDVHLTLAPLSLLDDVPVIEEIHARRVKVTEAGLDIVLGLARRDAAAGVPQAARSSNVQIERVVLEEVELTHRTLQLKPFDVELRLGPGNALRQATFLVRDKTFRLVMTPRGAGEIALDVQAKRWKVPVKTLGLTFESFAAQGVLHGRRLSLKPVRAALYGGRVAGEASLDWSARWDLRTALDIRGVDVAQLQHALRRPVKLSGRLSAQAMLHSRAKTPAALADALALDAPFRVDHGAFGGMDLSKVAIASGDETTSGGETGFEEFTGKLSVRGRMRRVDEFCARSSTLVAGGNVQVDARERLSGRLDVSIANTSGLIRVPVRLSGTSSDPVATPSRMMSVGAIIGTLLLPGVGTAIGASAANLLEGQVGCS